MFPELKNIINIRAISLLLAGKQALICCERMIPIFSVELG